MSKPLTTISLCLLIALLTACGTPAAPPETDDMEMEVPAEEATVEQAEPEEAVVEEAPAEEPTPTEEPTPEPVLEPLPADPIEQTIVTEDGVELTGIYFPAAVNPAPIIVMMHWAPGTQGDWFAEGHDWPQLALIMQNRQDEIASIGVLASPALQDRGDISYGVLTFDFRGFGDSPAGDRQKAYMDAQAAVAHAKTLEGADPNAIMTVGASIGADGALDGCILDGARDPACLAVISLSPGGYIGLDYAEQVGLAGDLSIACFATDGDTPSAEACNAGADVGAPNYQSTIFTGREHGMEMFGLGQEPDLLTFILDYFDAAAGS